MSKTVDERVVQMEFDNARFEQNVSQSMSTIERLKKSLNFDKAAKSFDGITKASNNVIMSGLDKAIETVNVKFSAMQVAGITALANITNSAVNTGERIASAFTIDPIKSGLSEYETQINAIQTILANTSSKGTTLDQVNSALDELNKYADMTIYNFTEMTRNIGTFTAAGVGLDTSVSAIKGIANIAAISGSNAQQASTAMYQLSQALAAGKVQLMDWNSVVNAGMGGEVFRTSLEETARVHGIAIDKMIAEEGSFRESLKTGWLTSSVLTETLAKFTGDLNEEQLKSIGYSEEQVAAIIKMGKMANDAATKVKTFSQLFDTLKEAAQSGWTQSWEIIIGDFEEAKDLFTGASDTLSELINKSAEARNKLLTGGLMSEWQQFAQIWSQTMGDGIAGVEGYEDTVKSVAKEHGVQIDKMILEMGSFDKTLKSGWLTNDIMNESLDRMAQKMSGLSKEELKAEGYTQEHVDAINKLNQAVKDGSVSIGNFTKKTGEMSGREHLIQAMKNSFQGLMSVVTPLGAAFEDTFGVTSEQIYNITVALDNFTSHLKLSDKQGDQLYRTFKGLFSIVNIVTTLLGGGLRIALKVAAGLFGVTGDSVLELTARIGDSVSAFEDWLFQNNIVAKGIQKTWSGLTAGATVIKGWIDSFSELPAVQTNVERFGASWASTLTKSKAYVFDGIGLVTKFIEKLKSLDDITLDDVKNILKDFQSEVAEYLSKAGDVFTDLRQSIKQFRDDVKTYFNDVGGSFDGLSSKIGWFVDFAKDKLGNIGLGELLTVGLGLSLILVLKKVSGFIDLLAHPIGSLTVLFDELVNAVQAYTLNLKAGAIIKIAEAIAILAGSIAVLTLLDQAKMWSAVGALGALAGGLIILAGAMGALNKYTNFTVASYAILALSASLLVLSVALKQMEDLDPTVAINNIALLGVLAVGLSGVVALLSKFSPKLSSGAFVILALATSIKIMVGALSDLNEITNETNVNKSVNVLLAAMIGLSMVVAAAGGVKFGNAASILAASVSLKILIGVIDDISDMDTSKITGNIGAFVITFGLFAGLMAATKLAGRHAAQAGVALVAISSAFILMAAAIKLISKISSDELGQASSTIAGLLIVFGGIIGISKLAGKHAMQAGVMIGMMSVAIMALTVSIAILGKLDADDVERGTNAVVKMQLCFALIVAMTALAKESKTTLVLISTTIAILAVALGALAMIKPEGLDQATKALGIVMGMFAVLIASSSLAKGSIAVLAVMGILVAEMAVVLYALGSLDTDKAIGIATSIGVLMLSMSASLGILALVGAAVVPALVGIAALDALILNLGLVLVGLGALVDKVPKVEEWLDKGIPILEKIGYALGSFFGNIVGGFASGATANLTEIGDNLGEFITSMQPFFNGVKGIDSTAIDGVKSLAETMLILTGTDLLTKFVSFLTGSSASGATANLTEIGDNLGEFITSMQPFFNGVKGIDSTAIDGVKSLAETMLILTGTDLLTKFVSFLTGSSGLDKFGSQLSSFGSAMVEYGNSVSGLNTEAISASAGAAKSLASVLDAIPNFGGLAAKIFGDNTFTAFAEGMIEFGKGLKSYGESVTGLNVEAIATSVPAARSLTELVDAMPNAGGLAGFLAGDNTFVTFTKGLVDFGAGLKSYGDTVLGVNVTAIEQSVKATYFLTDLVNAMPNSGGVAGFFAGNNDFVTFGKGLADFGTALVSYATAVSSLNSNAVAESVKVAKSLAELSNLDASGIMDFTKALGGVAEASVNEFVGVFVDNASNAKAAAENILAAFVEGIDEKAPDVTTAIDNSVATINEKQSIFEESGKYLIQGFINGINEKKTEIYNAASGMALMADSAVRDTLGIHSPAWTGIVLGNYYGAGLSQGISEKANSIWDAGKGLADNVLGGSTEGLKTGAKDFLGGISDILGGIPKAGKKSGDDWANGLADGINKGSKKAKGAAGKAAKSLYDITKEWIDEEKYYNRLTLEQELAKWQEIQAKYAEGTEERKNINREVYRVQNEIIKDAFDEEKKIIDDQRYYNTASLDDELTYWIGLQEKYLKLAEQYGETYKEQQEEIDKKVYQLRKDVLDDTYSKEKDYIDDKKYYGQMSLKEELSYWKGIQHQFLAGSEQRENAAKEVYRVEKELAKEAFDNAKSWISDRKYYNELSLSEELYAYEQLRDEYEEDSAERMEMDREVYRVEQEIAQAKEDLAKNLADVEADAAQQRIDLEQDYYDKTKEVNDQLKQDIEDLNQAYEDAVESRAKTIADSYNLWDHADVGGGVEGQVLLDNLDSQIKAMDDWQKNINSLADRGIGDGLLDELRNMGPSSASEIKALNELTDEQLTQYVALWQQKQQMAKDQAVLELEDMKTQTATKIDELTATANTQLEAYKTAWDTQLAEVNTNAATKLAELQATFDDKIGTISSETKSKVHDLTEEIEEAIEVSSENIVDEVTDLTENIQTAMETPDWVSIGTNIIAGIQKGLTDKAKELAETAARVAREALEAAEEELDINSPSGEFRKVGMYSDMGFANGLKSYAHLVTDQSTEVGSSALDSIKSAVAKVSDLIENGIDAVPTIRPVLDLTDIESEISRIGSMFSDSPVVSVGASINRANAQTIQNGVNQSPQITPSSYTFNQNNYSPKALSRSDIYRQTKNQFSTFERMAKA